MNDIFKTVRSKLINLCKIQVHFPTQSDISQWYINYFKRSVEIYG